MTRNKKIALVALPLFVNFGHALASSAKAISLPKDSVRISASADSIRRMMRDGVSLKDIQF